MKWLITGGCGFIGRMLAMKLLEKEGQRIRVLDNLSVGTRKDLAEIAHFEEMVVDSDASDWSPALAFREGDICNEADVAQVLHGADVVIHLAANTGVAPSVAEPIADCHNNVIGTLTVLDGCRASGVGRFIFASSGAPVGVQNPPLHEEMAPHPVSPYGASKLAGEGYCSAYYHCFGIDTVALRFGNVYGEGSGHKQSVVARFIKQAMVGERLEIYGDGTQTRDFIHISDLVDAIQRSATVPNVGGEIFQIATARETSVTEMTETLFEAMEAEGMTRPETYFGPKRDGDVMRNFSDTSKARERLGWEAKMQLKDGLRHTIRYFQKTAAA